MRFVRIVNHHILLPAPYSSQQIAAICNVPKKNFLILANTNQLLSACSINYLNYIIITTYKLLSYILVSSNLKAVATIDNVITSAFVTYYRYCVETQDRHPEGFTASTPPYILLADHRSHFSYLLPHYVLLPPPSSCIYRGSRATFTIKSFLQFLTQQSLQLQIVLY